MMAAHSLMGREDVDPSFMPFAGVTFDDPIADDVIEREGAPRLAPVEVSVYRQDDGAIVVQVDYAPYNDAEARVRVNVNDEAVFDQNIETGEDFT